MLTVAKYWAEAISNAKAVHDLLQIQDWMSHMEAVVNNVQNLHNIASSKPPPLLKHMVRMMAEPQLKLAPDWCLVWMIWKLMKLINQLSPMTL